MSGYGRPANLASKLRRRGGPARASNLCHRAGSKPVAGAKRNCAIQRKGRLLQRETSACSSWANRIDRLAAWLRPHDVKRAPTLLARYKPPRRARARGIVAWASFRDVTMDENG